jgi:hypothetical protein
LFDTSLTSLSFITRTDTLPAETLAVDLRPFIDTLLAEYSPRGGFDIPPDKMAARADGPAVRLKLCFRRIHLQRERDRFHPVYYETDILYKTGP